MWHERTIVVRFEKSGTDARPSQTCCLSQEATRIIQLHALSDISSWLGSFAHYFWIWKVNYQIKVIYGQVFQLEFVFKLALSLVLLRGHPKTSRCIIDCRKWKLEGLDNKGKAYHQVLKRQNVNRAYIEHSGIRAYWTCIKMRAASNHNHHTNEP